MAMRPKLWTLNGLSVELGVGARALAKKLKHVRPDGKIEGHDGWFMSSAVSALENDRRSDGGGGGYSAGQDAILDEIAQLGARLDAGFKQMAEEPDLERRRLMGVRLGPLVGRLEKLFAANLESAPIDERAFVKLGTDQILRRAIANFMGLCQYELSDDDDAADAA
jgi:hypothetical protein